MKRIYLSLFLACLLAGLVSCRKEETVAPPEFELYVPTVFTPDGDGVNDTFKVKGTNITQYHIDIYSPSNIIVYTSNDILQGWDGRYKNENMPPDNYLWLIEYVNSRSEKRKSSGYVELIR
jgi:gliding motility-associated-like protein